jgi:hypothetical protein
MNERIKQIAEQALDYAEKNQSADIPFHWFALHNDKLVELIVRECVDMVVNEALQYAEPVWSVELVNDIKEHFGIEE